MSEIIEDFASLDAENALIGGLLLDNRLFDRIGDRVKSDHFFSDRNRDVFAEIAKQLATGKPCDIVTVAMSLGGAASLAELHKLAQYVPSAGSIERYADILIERAKSRALRAVSAEITELAGNHDRPIAARVDEAQGLLTKLMDDAPRDDWVGAYEGMVEHSGVLDKRYRGEVTAWSTGLSELDDYLEGGLRPGELVIVGARPSMGKTALGLSIGVNMAADRPVAVLSMEMSHQEVRDRLTAMLGQVSMSSIKQPGRGEGLKWDRVMDGVEKAKHLRLRVSDQGGLTINQVRSKARNAKRAGGLDVLVVDYIGLMTSTDTKANRTQQLGEISRGLKTLAKELQICVLCLAQLNRGAVDERPEQMPQMSSLRDSGEIEQDADVILFIKRPIMDNADLGDEWKHYAKLSIAKNRQGRCGYLHLMYQGDQTRFTTWHGEPPRREVVQSSKRGMQP